MKTKITIKSPIHIGNGESKRNFEYYLKNNIVYCYDINQIFECIPSEKLIDKRFLNALTSKEDGSKKKYFNNLINNNVDYNNLKPIYCLRGEFSQLSNKNVNVQLKSLNKPYIPGSTIKGAIRNAIIYDIVKNNLEKFYLYIKINHSMKIDNFIKSLYPNDIAFNDFMMQFFSCIICRDIYFEKMVLVEARRDNVDLNNSSSQNSKLGFENYECIDVNQETIDDFIIIDNDKIKYSLTKNYSNYACFSDFIKYLDASNIIKVCSQYFNEIFSEEIAMDNINGYYASEGLDTALRTIAKDNVENGFYLRIGKNTNYFFKTISYLVLKNNPKLYKEKFYQVFSPIALKKANKNQKDKKSFSIPKADKMPASRTIYIDDKYAYYPGIIKIEFIV